MTKSMEPEVNSLPIADKICDYCRDMQRDGMHYGDYLEQLTYLLFLKTTHERSQPPYNKPSLVPLQFAWPSLLGKEGDALFQHYDRVLEHLGSEKGLLGLMFANARNRFRDPAKLRRLIVDLIDRENWSSMNLQGESDARGSGSGQLEYFSPTALLRSLVNCVRCRKGRGDGPKLPP
jgi:type I restriction enzyme M protein